MHSIPRSYNPSGMHNSDQYLLCIAVDASDTDLIAEIKQLTDAIATAASVTVELY